MLRFDVKSAKQENINRQTNEMNHSSDIRSSVSGAELNCSYHVGCQVLFVDFSADRLRRLLKDKCDVSLLTSNPCTAILPLLRLGTADDIFNEYNRKQRRILDKGCAL